MVLPHVLEFSAHPHRILREAARVLMPDGQIVISGFNPLSLWGMRRALGPGRKEFPWRGRFIGLLRLKDWLQLLSFELNGGRFGCYAPPFAQAKWLERSAFMEKAGDRWWPIAGGVYVVRAVKRTVGMRLVMPNWRTQPASAQSPVAGDPVATITAPGPKIERCGERGAGAHLYRWRLQGQSGSGRLGRAVAVRWPREGALRRRTGHHQQSHGTHRRDSRAGGAEAALRHRSLYRLAICAERNQRVDHIAWKRRGWKTADKKPVKNVDLWLELDRLVAASPPSAGTG